MKEKLLKYKFVFEELVKRDFKKKYKGTVLGMGWSVLSPLLSLLIMKLIFTNFLGRDTPHYTTYLFCGNLIFSYFREASKMGMSSLRSNASIFTKVTVPKSLFLFSRNVQTLINFGLTLPLLFLFCAFDHITFTWKFFMLIYPILTLIILNLGVGLILSALYVFFKDMDYLWNIFLMLLNYMSAIFYRADQLGPAMQHVLQLNPVYLHIYYFRCITIDGFIPSPLFHLAMLAYVLVIFAIGALIYKKYNAQFLYYV